MRLATVPYSIPAIILLLTQCVNLGFIQAAPKQAITHTYNIAYLTQEQAIPAALSNLDPFIKDKGVIGAELGIDDDNTTGEFTGQQFNLKKFIIFL